MPCIPHIHCGVLDARARRNGRYAWADFTLWPQWFFEEHAHLAFVRRRPYRDQDLANHPLRMMWWDVGERDFVEEEGTCYDGLGHLSSARYKELDTFALEILERVKEHEKANGRGKGWLNLCANCMRDTTMRLKYVPMTMRDLVYTVAAFQRQYLETLAYLDFAQKWIDRFAQAVDEPRPPVDMRLMGCVTDAAHVVQQCLRVGVPVYYVRPPGSIPSTINIVEHVIPDYPPREYIVTEDWPDDPFPTVLSGMPSASLVTACLRHRPGFLNWKSIDALPAHGNAPDARLEPIQNPSHGPVRNPGPAQRFTPCKCVSS
jgi:hypothetical protein